MGRIRSTIWYEPKFIELSITERLLLLGLLTLRTRRGVIRHTIEDAFELLCIEGGPDNEERVQRLVATGLIGPIDFVPRVRRPALPQYIRRRVVERYGMVCQLCGGDIPEGDLHIDHIHPVALGGGDELSNLQTAHSKCNISKGTRV